LVDALYYVAIGAQVVIGTTLAALGPVSKLHPTAITIPGVVNTSTAGVLAFLKGQGLPDRLRKDEFEMRKVQDFIEETETMLVIAGDSFTKEELDDKVYKVLQKYNTARDTTEMNRPASYGHQVEEGAEPTGSAGAADVDMVIPAGYRKGKDRRFIIS